MAIRKATPPPQKNVNNQHLYSFKVLFFGNKTF